MSNNDLFKGVSSNENIINDNLTSDVTTTEYVTATVDNSIYVIYAGNGSNGLVSKVVLNINFDGITLYVNRIINVSYGVITYTTPPFKSGSRIKISAEASFSSGSAILEVDRLY